MKFRHFLPIAAALAAGGLWGLGSLLTRSTPSAVAVPLRPAHLVSIDSAPGIRLAGTYWPSTTGAPAILLLHGNGSNRDSMTPMASWLNAHKYGVLSIDFRGHGASSPAGKSFGLFEAEDAHAALAWLRRQHPESRVGVIGFSLGGAASLLGRQGPLGADAFVLEGVYPDIRHAIFNRLASRLGRWPATLLEPLLSYQSLPRFKVWPSSITPILALRQVRVPVMIVGGGSDTNTPPDETQAMYEAVRQHGEMHILQGVTHDDLGRTLSAALQAPLLDFLDRNLNAVSAAHDGKPLG